MIVDFEDVLDIFECVILFFDEGKLIYVDGEVFLLY